MLTILNATTPGGTPLIYPLNCTWNRAVCAMLRPSLSAADTTTEWEQAYVCPYEQVRVLHYCGRTRGSASLADRVVKLEIPAIQAARHRATLDAILADPAAAAWAKDAAQARLTAL